MNHLADFPESIIVDPCTFFLIDTTRRLQKTISATSLAQRPSDQREDFVIIIPLIQKTIEMSTSDHLKTNIQTKHARYALEDIHQGHFTRSRIIPIFYRRWI